MTTKIIHVAGDVCVDILGVPQPRLSPQAHPELQNWRLTGEIRAHWHRGGALLLADMLAAACKDCRVQGPQLMAPPDLCGGKKDVPLDEKQFVRLTRDDIVHSVIRVGDFRTSADSSKKDRTLRVERAEGFSGPVKGAPSIQVEAPRPAAANIVVLDDTGNDFRNSEEQWPAAVSRRDGANPQLIVHKLHRPLPLPTGAAPPAAAQSALWREIEKHHSDRRVVVLSVGDLRDDDVPISRGLSWERTALDLVWHLMNEPGWQALRDTPHLVVRLGLDGAVYWQGHEAEPGDADAVSGNDFKAWLVYNPGGIEGSWDSAFEGQMVAYGSAFTAGLVGKLAEKEDPGDLRNSRAEDNTDLPPAQMIDAIRAGLAASRRLLKYGFGPVGSIPAYPNGALFQSLAPKEHFFACQQIPIIPDSAVPDRGYWRLIESVFAGNARLLHRAVALVARGAKAPAEPPGNEDSIATMLLAQSPVAAFAGLRAYDRREIESYRSLFSLMSDYVRQTSVLRPLSVAVFGPPGAGKSFGVKMVAKSLEQSGSRAIETLTFNLSQYGSADELAAAFHLVRDVVLRGRIPLVFFDEFDTALAGKPLGWLRCFLSPMQDAEFIDRGAPHPIGQSIFIFAGGTCNSYAEFARPFIQKDGPGADKEAYQRFRDAKGPDFLSRLRGTLDIPGLDLDTEFDAYGPTEAFPCEAAILLRRANILAYQLGEKAPGLEDADKTLQVTESVIRALLHLPRFAHGNRSFEALLDISHLVGQTRFTPSLLPAAGDAALHANPGQMMQLLAKDYPYPPKDREAIAEAIHRAYLDDRRKSGPFDPNDRSTRDWESLDEDLQESNRQQADHIAVKLRAVGLWFRKRIPGVPASSDPGRHFERNVEKLARMEHDRWVAEKRRSGWIPAPDMERKSRNNRLRLHNYIFSWDALTDAIKDLDRTAVRKIPEFLSAACYEIYEPIDNDVSLPPFESASAQTMPK